MLAADNFAHSQDEQNQSAGDLEVGDGDAERAENEFAEKNETDRDAKAGEDSRNAWWRRFSGELAAPSPIKSAISPIGSTATKTGMNASKNFWSMRGRFCLYRASFSIRFSPFRTTKGFS